MTSSIILDRDLPGRHTSGLPKTRPALRVPAHSGSARARTPGVAPLADLQHTRTQSYRLRPAPRADGRPLPRETRAPIDMALWQAPAPEVLHAEEEAQSDELATPEAPATLEAPAADAPIHDLTSDLRGNPGWRLLALVGAIIGTGSALVAFLLP